MEQEEAILALLLQAPSPVEEELLELKGQTQDRESGEGRGGLMQRWKDGRISQMRIECAARGNCDLNVQPEGTATCTSFRPRPDKNMAPPECQLCEVHAQAPERGERGDINP